MVPSAANGGRAKGVDPPCGGSRQRFSWEKISRSRSTGSWRRSTGESDRRRRALAWCAFEVHRPAEAFAQLAHDRQAHAATGGIGLVAPEERLECPPQGVPAHADAGVANDDA